MDCGDLECAMLSNDLTLVVIDQCVDGRLEILDCVEFGECLKLLGVVRFVSLDHVGYSVPCRICTGHVWELDKAPRFWIWKVRFLLPNVEFVNEERCNEVRVITREVWRPRCPRKARIDTLRVDGRSMRN